MPVFVITKFLNVEKNIVEIGFKKCYLHRILLNRLS